MLRVGIIGLRHGHIFSFVRDVQSSSESTLVAVAEDEPGLKERAHGLNVSLYDDYRRMIDKEKLDAVGVAAINSEKGEVIAECLDRGLHVIADKPLLTGLQALEQVRSSWQRSGKKLISMLTLRYDRPFVALRRFVADGDLGEPVAFYASGPHKLNKPTRYPWMLRDDLCGGIIVDLGCHYVDLIRWFSGKECLALASAHGNKRFPELEGFTDFGHVQMRLADGVVGTAHVDWLTPDAAPYHGDTRFFVIGTRGTAEIREWPWPQVIVATVERSPFTLDLGPAGPTVGTDFLQAIIEQRETALKTEDCLEATRLTILARQAAETGDIVKA